MKTARPLGALLSLLQLSVLLALHSLHGLGQEPMAVSSSPDDPAGRRAAQGAAECPSPIDPAKGFVGNFLNSCYWIPVATGTGGTEQGGDQNALYSMLTYRVDPGYELIVVGEFPPARFLSVTLYDDHNYPNDGLYDVEILPLSTGFVNPFGVDKEYREDQLYAVQVTLGGLEPAEGALEAGCQLESQFRFNLMQGTARHFSQSWNHEVGLPEWFPPHDDLGPNAAGVLSIRRYLEESEGDGGIQLRNPILLVRNLENGCAVTAQEALEVAEVVTLDPQVRRSWVDEDQINAHFWYEQEFVSTLCRDLNLENGIAWYGGTDWYPGANPDAEGLSASLLPTWLVDHLIGTGRFMRLRFRIPAVADTPCKGCRLTGLEEMRYWSLSFAANGGRTVLTSIADRDVVIDPDGYATIIVGFGSSRPENVVADHGYTWIDLSGKAGFEALSTLMMRNILPHSDFPCSAREVPPHTLEHHSLGGFTGEYLPVGDFPLASEIPDDAQPLIHPDSCRLEPPEPAVPCYP